MLEIMDFIPFYYRIMNIIFQVYEKSRYIEIKTNY